MSEKFKETVPPQESKEKKQREIQYTYPASDSNLDLFYDIVNHVARLEDEYPECESEVIETEDDINDEDAMTITIKFKANEKDQKEIKKFFDENFAPAVFEK